MSARYKLYLISTLLISILFTGCLPGASIAPTLNLDSLRAEVVQTVIAQFTLDAVQHPTALPSLTIPPTSLPIPLPTSTTNDVVIPSPTLQTQPSLPIVSTLQPTMMNTAPPVVHPVSTQPKYSDTAQLIERSPYPDYVVFQPGVYFTAKWTMKNTGLHTWTTNYEIHYSAGTNLGAPKVILLPNNVAIGDQIEISMGMKAPDSPGKYVSTWALLNNNNDKFFYFYTAIEVQ